MKGNGTDIEIIEGYVLGKLSPSDKAAFEAGLRKDPLLNTEVAMQKDTIASLQAFRKAELKARLQGLEVPAPNWFSAPKIAASAFIAAAGITALIYFNQQQTPVEAISESNNPSTTVVVSDKPVAEQAPVTTIQEKDNKSVALVKDTKPVEPHNVESEAEITPAGPPQVVVPNPSDDFTHFDNADKNVSLPESSIASTVDNRTKNLEVDIVEEEGKLRYKYFNHKLFLYGNFNSSPYEVLELNTHKGKELFLYFKNNYYRVVSNTTEVSDLLRINEPGLRTQLESIRRK